MPGGDRTGPLGKGPGSGRRGGFCSGYNMPGYMNAVPGRGLRGGFGNWCRGMQNRFRATGQPGWMRGGWYDFGPGTMAYNPDTEKQALEQEIQGLESELNRLRNYLKQLSTAKSEEE